MYAPARCGAAFDAGAVVAHVSAMIALVSPCWPSSWYTSTTLLLAISLQLALAFAAIRIVAYRSLCCRRVMERAILLLMVGLLLELVVSELMSAVDPALDQKYCTGGIAESNDAPLLIFCLVLDFCSVCILLYRSCRTCMDEIDDSGDSGDSGASM
jgi:hypothetical protein